MMMKEFFEVARLFACGVVVAFGCAVLIVFLGIQLLWFIKYLSWPHF